MPTLQIRLEAGAKITGIHVDAADVPVFDYECEEDAPAETKARTFYIERGTPVFDRLFQIAKLAPGLSCVHATDVKKRLLYVGVFECKEPAFTGHVFELIESE